MTGNGVSGSISVEFAPSSPQTWRANSETATCMPRQIPRYGISRSRATWQARIFPSQPREPKPPGTSTPSTCSSSRAASSYDMCSASTQRTRTRAPWWTPACLSASCTERYASWSFTYLPTSAISTSSSSSRLRSMQLLPLAEVGSVALEAELLADERVEALGTEHLGNEVDVGDVGGPDDRVRVDVGEERDLLADVVGQRLGRARDDDVRVDTDPAELVHRVLRRLRLQLARGLDERDERDVQVEDVLGPDLAPELPDRLEERQRLDVADGAADLGDHDVRGRDLLRAPDAHLDLVRDVRDHLHGRAEELALALLAQDGVPDRAGSVARVAREVLVDEALVVADVEVGLGPVLGHEHLAVLERAHRARVDVQVRVELLRRDGKAARFEESPERCGDDPLAQRGNDSTRDEHVPGHGVSP